MTEGQICYVARSERKLAKEEMEFHLQQNFKTNEEIARELVARGYRIIGYTNHIGMFDLEDRFLPDTGVEEGDIAILWDMASLLMPKERWRFAGAVPLPTAREAAELAAKSVVLAVAS